MRSERTWAFHLTSQGTVLLWTPAICVISCLYFKQMNQLNLVAKGMYLIPQVGWGRTLDTYWFLSNGDQGESLTCSHVEFTGALVRTQDFIGDLKALPIIPCLRGNKEIGYKVSMVHHLSLQWSSPGVKDHIEAQTSKELSSHVTVVEDHYVLECLVMQQ